MIPRCRTAYGNYQPHSPVGCKVHVCISHHPTRNKCLELKQNSSPTFANSSSTRAHSCSSHAQVRPSAELRTASGARALGWLTHSANGWWVLNVPQLHCCCCCSSQHQLTVFSLYSVRAGRVSIVRGPSGVTRNDHLSWSHRVESVQLAVAGVIASSSVSLRRVVTVF